MCRTTIPPFKIKCIRQPPQFSLSLLVVIDGPAQLRVYCGREIIYRWTETDSATGRERRGGGEQNSCRALVPRTE